jgi:hypothetical protein
MKELGVQMIPAYSTPRLPFTPLQAGIESADLMVWTPPGDELSREVRLNGSKNDRVGYREARVSGAWSGREW